MPRHKDLPPNSNLKEKKEMRLRAEKPLNQPTTTTMEPEVNREELRELLNDLHHLEGQIGHVERLLRKTSFQDDEKDRRYGLIMLDIASPEEMQRFIEEKMHGFPFQLPGDEWKSHIEGNGDNIFGGGGFGVNQRIYLEALSATHRAMQKERAEIRERLSELLPSLSLT